MSNPPEAIIQNVVNGLVDIIVYVYNFKSNVQSVEDKVAELLSMEGEVDQEVVVANREAKVIGLYISWWKGEVTKIKDKSDQVLKGANKVKGGYLKGHLNLPQRFLLSRKAAQLIVRIAKILDDGRKHIRLEHGTVRAGMLPACSTTASEELESRMKLMEQAMAALQNNEVYMNGICGMDDVGKTRLSAEVKNRGRCRRFTLAEMKKATDSFSGTNFLGRGGEGMVFKGVLALADGRRQVAVKRLKKQTSTGECESFEKEIKMLSKFHHANLVTLIGYCHESNEHILVYELMPNGNLRDKLNNTASPLSYEQRVLICIGAARAIEYLHTGTSLDSKIIHRDVKPDNILLTEKMEAKVSDMGLSRIISANQTHSSVTTLHICGTPGYYAPEYYLTGNFTWRIDVYAFGMVLAEVLCKKRPPPLRDDKHRESFSKWALRYVDPVLNGAVSQSSLEAFIKTAEKCLNKDPDQRPTMNQVVGMLDSALKLQKCGDGGGSSKSSANGEKRQVDSESSSRKLSIDFRKSKSAKFENTSSGSTISESTCHESYVRSTAEKTKPSQESRVYKSLGKSEVGAEDARYSYSSGQVGKIQENSNNLNA